MIFKLYATLTMILKIVCVSKTKKKVLTDNENSESVDLTTPMCYCLFPVLAATVAIQIVAAAFSVKVRRFCK